MKMIDKLNEISKQWDQFIIDDISNIAKQWNLKKLKEDQDVIEKYLKEFPREFINNNQIVWNFEIPGVDYLDYFQVLVSKYKGDYTNNWKITINHKTTPHLKEVMKVMGISYNELHNPKNMFKVIDNTFALILDDIKNRIKELDSDSY